MAEEVCSAAGGDLVPGVVAVAAFALNEIRGGGMFGFVEELRNDSVGGYLFVAGGLEECCYLGIEFVVTGGGDVGLGLGGDAGTTEEAGEAEAPGLEGNVGECCAGAGVVAVVLSHDGTNGGFREALEFFVAVCDICSAAVLGKGRKLSDKPCSYSSPRAASLYSSVLNRSHGSSWPATPTRRCGTPPSFERLSSISVIICTRDSSERVASIRRNSSHSTFGKISASVSSASLREAVLASASAEEETEAEDLRRRTGALALEERRDSIGHGGRGEGVAIYRKQRWTRGTALYMYICSSGSGIF